MHPSADVIIHLRIREQKKASYPFKDQRTEKSILVQTLLSKSPSEQSRDLRLQ
jgi:hypothetical protein